MKEIYSDVIQFRGTHYEFGYKQGLALKHSLAVENRANQWKIRKPRFTIDAVETKKAITRFAPAIWDELEGLQEALAWPMEKVLMEFGGYRLDIAKSGCSILTGKNFLARNYDYHPKTYEGRYVLFQPADTGYAIIGPSQRVTGRMDGMNEKGLAIGYTFIHRKNPGDGFICCMIGRLILESCANVQEAVRMLIDIPHRHSFSYVIYDKSGETRIVEASPRGVAVREGNICANHFEILKKENRHHLADSKRRTEILAGQKEKIANAKAAFRLLNARDQGVFSELYGSWAGTIHTAVYLPKKLEAWIALGGDSELARFDFAKWLAGEDVELTRITGKVDTDIPFLHMDEGADWFKHGQG
ncbi:choloylglycine hydrolase [Weizmannia acidilactici]|mgnify:CR=1 FL=1|uniref:C45 family autoproteolytic acyltransferase/hydolase n=1 Tax=Weizmannia acidilactici TaxID=2607726 RepID=UPI00124CEDC8|nr:C45 family peptidase [Weizmannia acidilactici]GER67131.1 choloylglycine hydrolase [Weizmannia acidilactici]